MDSHILWGTSNVCLEFGRNTYSLVVFVNSDYAVDHDKKISYMLCTCGCAISWKATLQHVVALFIDGVEYMIIVEVIKEALWSLQTLCQLSLHQGGITGFWW